MFKNIFTRLLIGSLTVCIFLSQGISASAKNAIEERVDAQRAMEIQSNLVDNWPTGPIVTAESAILIEAGTGAVLYAKNIHQKEYPASTTKILTTLIAAEQCSLDEEVSFSHEAVFSIPRDSNHIAIDEGQALSMEDCLNAILIRSANEVSNAVAEHIGGSIDGFADMMNERAKELGCVDSHFANPNGLPDENHYTSAYDLAQIGRAFFDTELLCRISTTRMMHLLPTEKQPNEKMEVSNNQLLPGGNYAYEYLVGAKTGYTNDARSCLVSCAEKNGLKLICVVMRDEAPLQYEDTLALFEYGFSNFEKVNISQTETKYNIDNSGFLHSDNAIFGNSKPLLSLNKSGYLVLPKTIRFEDTKSSISYDTGNEEQAAVICYTYRNVFLGSATLDFTAEEEDTYTFNKVEASSDEKENAAKKPAFFFINIGKVLLAVAIIAALIAILFIAKAILKNYQFMHPSTRASWHRSRRNRRSHYQSPEISLKKRRREQIKQAKRRHKARRTNRNRDYDF